LAALIVDCKMLIPNVYPRIEQADSVLTFFVKDGNCVGFIKITGTAG
jgi:hypothetical protein